VVAEGEWPWKEIRNGEKVRIDYQQSNTERSVSIRSSAHAVQPPSHSVLSHSDVISWPM
jgi:hypothetical protein